MRCRLHADNWYLHVARELRNKLKIETERNTGESELMSLSEKAAAAEYDPWSGAKIAAGLLHMLDSPSNHGRRIRNN
jgi:hypothetical protein